MKKLCFAEVYKKIKDYNPDYELIEYIKVHDIILKYLPTGEIFHRSLEAFLKGSAHAPSMAKQIGAERAKKTNLEKYGCPNPFGNKEIQDKIKQTNLKKYGCANPLQNELVKEKAKQTNLEKYGVEHTLQNKEIQEKAKQTNLEKYGCANVAQNKEIQDKIKMSRIESGDVRYLKGKTIKELSEEKKVSITQLNRLYNKGIDITKYSKSSGTNIEQVIKSVLEDLGVQFEREKRFNDNKIRVDFYVPKFELAIEANGLYWHRAENKGENYHFNRRETLNSLGIKVIQFNGIEILEDPIRIKYMILDMIETGGRESLVYENDYILVNLDYSLCPQGEVLEAWIEKYKIEDYELCNSGMLKIKA